MAEPVVVVEDAAPQTAQEHAKEQPTVGAVVETTEEHPAPVRTGAVTPMRDGESARTPPPSSVAEEDRAPTPPPAEEGKVPTPPQAEASSPKDSPGLDQGPVMAATMAGVVQRAKGPRRPPMMKWRRSRVVPKMVASTFMCGANVGTISLVMKNSRRRRRPRGWIAQPNG